MIPLNTPQKLSPAAFWYTAVAPLAVSFLAVIVGSFLKTVVLSACAMQACPAYVPFILPAVVILFVVCVLAQPVLSYLLFSFVVAEHSITINSGIIFRQYETIQFSRIQTLDLERGPLLWLFGLTEVRLWTASTDQMNVEIHEHSAQTHATPDTIIILERDTAQQFKEHVVAAQHPGQQ